jgi:pimeloyl-ACP methyl ester carboxylesterase
MPYFGARALRRLGPEIDHARDSWPRRWQLGVEYAGRVIRSPFSPMFAAQWVREWSEFDLANECARITAPTLVITGEPALERVVPVEGSLEYLQLIPGATHAVLAGTGHIGLITKPHRFAELAGGFIYAANSVERSARPAEERARHAS